MRIEAEECPAVNLNQNSHDIFKMNYCKMLLYSEKKPANWNQGKGARAMTSKEFSGLLRKQEKTKKKNAIIHVYFFKTPHGS